MSGLTQREAETLAYLQVWESRSEMSPSYEEIMKHLGLSSKSGVHRILGQLESKRRITRHKGRARSISVIVPLKTADVPTKPDLEDLGNALIRAGMRMLEANRTERAA